MRKCAELGLTQSQTSDLYKEALAVVRRPDGTLVQYGSHFGSGAVRNAENPQTKRVGVVVGKEPISQPTERNPVTLENAWTERPGWRRDAIERAYNSSYGSDAAKGEAVRRAIAMPVESVGRARTRDEMIAYNNKQQNEQIASRRAIEDNLAQSAAASGAKGYAWSSKPKEDVLAGTVLRKERPVQVAGNPAQQPARVPTPSEVPAIDPNVFRNSVRTASLSGRLKNDSLRGLRTASRAVRSVPGYTQPNGMNLAQYSPQLLEHAGLGGVGYKPVASITRPNVTAKRRPV